MIWVYLTLILCFTGYSAFCAHFAFRNTAEMLYRMDRSVTADLKSDKLKAQHNAQLKEIMARANEFAISHKQQAGA